MKVALLSGGTGGAKLARGLLDVVGAENLTVIANTGDDAWVHGAHVSPDPDLVTYWLADAIDERGSGISGDSWQVMDARETAGRPTWFRLGDRDLAMCLIRSELLAAGERLTDAHAAVVDAMGVKARVLPMCDEPVPTRVGVRGRLLPFQEFMIVERAEGPLESVEFAGIDAAWPAPEVLDALRCADAIVIGPSNPIVSIGPILAVPGMRAPLPSSPARRCLALSKRLTGRIAIVRIGRAAGRPTLARAEPGREVERRGGDRPARRGRVHQRRRLKHGAGCVDRLVGDEAVDEAGV